MSLQSERIPEVKKIRLFVKLRGRDVEDGVSHSLGAEISIPSYSPVKGSQLPFLYYAKHL